MKKNSGAVGDLFVIRTKAVPGATLRQLLEAASTFAEVKFKHTGRISPMWHADTGEEWLIVACQLGDKDAAAAAIRALFAEEKVVRYLFIDEAWILERRKTKGEAITEAEMAAISKHGLEHHPDRREVVMFSAEDRDGRQLLGRRYILRPEHGKATLSPLVVEDLTGVGRSEGRLVNMLGPLGRTH